MRRFLKLLMLSLCLNGLLAILAFYGFHKEISFLNELLVSLAFVCYWMLLDLPSYPKKKHYKQSQNRIVVAVLIAMVGIIICIWINRWSLVGLLVWQLIAFKNVIRHVKDD
ncbi:hypothetical protein [Streptococcus sp. zg-JUN1979]|uniref:hypothetical protein n=1 Tax=Streptococcus sp. zg-JUN1979 TaxID=3391450 RepID=UPI0039A619AD